MANNSVSELDIAKFIKNYSFGNLVYSNSSFLAYYYHGKPHKKFYSMRDLYNIDLQGEIAKGNHIEIIWFNNTHNLDMIYTIDSNIKTKVLFENKNATVYDVYGLK